MIRSFTSSMVTILRKNLEYLCAEITALFDLKQKLLGNSDSIKSVKLHLIRHSHVWISEYGSLLNLDTETWESLLRSVAKKPYRRSQKRKEGMLDIMTEKVKRSLYLLYYYFRY